MTGDQRAARVREMDALATRAFEALVPGSTTGLALVAVGGYGRGDLAPASDLDLVLVHAEDVDPGPVATELWYPWWDAGLKLDHAVRSLDGMVAAAQQDVRVALGLLDARHVAGDPHLTLQLRTRVLADWRRGARARLPKLASMTRRRHERSGELAHEGVPDLKEAHGGLRDFVVLDGLRATWLVDVPHADLARARRGMLDVRDALHTVTGRAGDRIAPELWGELASELGLPDALAAQRHVRGLGRRAAHLSRLTWRRVEAHLAGPAHTAGPRRPRLEQLAPGVALSAGEVVLAPGARVADAPLLLLRAAAVAAEQGVPLSPATAARLVRDGARVPTPWPEPARGLLVRLLGAGAGLREVWETLEETGAVDLLLPEWEQVRLLPHSSTAHRHTVDRHLVETCVAASDLLRAVARPDLLLVTALLHDLGKGQPGDHSLTGAPMAAEVARRWGFGPMSVGLVERCVREHLLLTSTLTTRDPEDPATAEWVAERVGHVEALDLLGALTEADVRAVNPTAWSTWRAGQVRDLVARTAAVLGPGQVLEPEPEEVPEWMCDGELHVEVAGAGGGLEVLVVAPDRVGLAAEVARLLTRSGVHRARAGRVPGSGALAWSRWWIDDLSVDPAVLRHHLRLPADTPTATPPAPVRGSAAQVLVHEVEGARSTALEVRAADTPGLLHRLLSQVAATGADLVAAHVETRGPQAVDVLHLRGADGRPLAGRELDRLVAALRSTLTPPEPAALV